MKDYSLEHEDQEQLQYPKFDSPIAGYSIQPFMDDALAEHLSEVMYESDFERDGDGYYLEDTYLYGHYMLVDDDGNVLCDDDGPVIIDGSMGGLWKAQFWKEGRYYQYWPFDEEGVYHPATFENTDKIYSREDGSVIDMSDLEALDGCSLSDTLNGKDIDYYHYYVLLNSEGKPVINSDETYVIVSDYAGGPWKGKLEEGAMVPVGADQYKVYHEVDIKSPENKFYSQDGKRALPLRRMPTIGIDTHCSIATILRPLLTEIIPIM